MAGPVGLQIQSSRRLLVPVNAALTLERYLLTCQLTGDARP